MLWIFKPGTCRGGGGGGIFYRTLMRRCYYYCMRRCYYCMSRCYYCLVWRFLFKSQTANNPNPDPIRAPVMYFSVVDHYYFRDIF